MAPLPVALIADDLTGALDTAAQFVGGEGSIPVYWGEPPCPFPGGAIAIDGGTRESPAVRTAIATLAARLPRRRETVLYAKLDSLLRGHAGAEVAGWVEAVAPAHCIVAPAFPHQGRVTRGGIQYARAGDGWRAVGRELAADLQREGLSVWFCRPGDPVPAGVSLWDAETEADLLAIAAAGRAAAGPVLWCGSGGLAAAVVESFGRPPRGSSLDTLCRPVLGLFGTDHAVTMEQLAACGALVRMLPDGGAASAAVLSRQLAERGAALACLDLPGGLSRDEAARRIETELGRLANSLEAPGTLIVAGGQTLRALCGVLHAGWLDVDGQIEPGVPCSVMRGGRFDGVRVISKSGGFGDPGLLLRLVNHLPEDRP